METTDARGRFVWYDLLTTDPQGAAAFYTAVAGWGTQQWEGGDSTYTMWTNKGTPLGGIVDLTANAAGEGVPPHWMAYIGTPDIEALVSRAKELGGTVLHGPEDIPSVGRFAILMDPQQAVFAAFQASEQAPGQNGAPGVGDISWHELGTSDLDAAYAFYHDLFRWEKLDAMDMGEGDIYQMFGHHGHMLGGMYRMDGEQAPGWLLYVKVEDIQQALDTVRERGGKVLNGPMEVPGGSLVAQCLDPQGAAFAAHQDGADQ